MIESAQTTLVVQSAVSHGLKKYIYERKSIKFYFFLDSVGVQVVPAASAAVIEQVLVLIQHQDDQGLPRCLDQHGLKDLHQVHLYGDGHGHDCLHGPVCQDGRPRQVPHDISVQQEEDHITMELVIN